MNHTINRLLHFGLQQNLFAEEDYDYVANLVLDVLKINVFCYELIEERLDTATPLLEELLENVIQRGLIEDTIGQRDLFDTKIMNCLMPRPSEIIKLFNQKYQNSPKEAMDYYYHLSLASNYIRKERINKNINFKKYYKYATFDITINLSKPEKDSKEIIAAKLIKSSNYPKCLLCKQNVGFSGNLKHPSRVNHRIIPVSLDNDLYYLQYSPYLYYHQHCIILNKEHIPMIIDKKTLQHLVSFVELFPHYMIGSNADLPIVGGSILSHDHYQGGYYHFPIQDAKIIKSLRLQDFPDIQIELLNWPLSTIRLTAEYKENIVELANLLLKRWKQYSNPSLDIIAFSHDTPHNTITPIARRVNHQYQIDLILRNNRTTEQYPDGIFHPHASLHHIKKENIGLIEAMGLAILPSRLQIELELLKDCLLGNKVIHEYPELDKHKDWFYELQQTYRISKETITDTIQEAITIKFVKVLEDAGVFKMNDQGIQAFIEFVEGVSL